MDPDARAPVVVVGASDPSLPFTLGAPAVDSPPLAVTPLARKAWSGGGCVLHAAAHANSPIAANREATFMTCLIPSQAWRHQPCSQPLLGLVGRVSDRR